MRKPLIRKVILTAAALALSLGVTITGASAAGTGLDGLDADFIHGDVAALGDEKVTDSAAYNHAAMDDLRHLGTKIDAAADLFDAQKAAT